jgi:hypothetical protein
MGSELSVLTYTLQALADIQQEKREEGEVRRKHSVNSVHRTAGVVSGGSSSGDGGGGGVGSMRGGGGGGGGGVDYIVSDYKLSDYKVSDYIVADYMEIGTSDFNTISEHLDTAGK